MYSPTPLTLTDLADLEVGKVMNARRGCCPDKKTGYQKCFDQGFTFPRNGEFSYLRGDYCQMCMTQKGKECKGSGTIKGRRPAVKRLSYLADPYNCCVLSNDTHDGKTCDPKYRNRSNAECKNHIKNYCSQGTRVLQESGICKTFCEENPQDCAGLKSRKCNETKDLTVLEKQKCVNFCLGTLGQGKCDTFMQKRCSDDDTKKNPECACINSEIKRYKPQCNDAACTTNGYMTGPMMASSNCPSVIDCGVYFDIRNVSKDVRLSDVTTEQRCTGNTDTVVAKPQTDDQVPDMDDDQVPDMGDDQVPVITDDNEVPTGKETSRRWIWWVVLVVVVLVIIIAVVFFAFRSPRSALQASPQFPQTRFV